MALKIRTVMTYPLNGSTVDFGITFEYLARKFVSVTLIGKDRKELVLNQDFRFTTKTQITTTRAWGPSDGYTMIEIRRVTSATDRLVDFSDGSILRAYDLNIAQVQTLHVAEEARDLTADTIGVNNDGNLDARGRKIVNVGDATNPDEAVNLGQIQRWNESALNSAKNARDSEDRAWQHRESARVSDEHATSKAGEAASSADWSKKWATDVNVVEIGPGGESLRSSKTYSEWAKGDSSVAYNAKELALTYRNDAENFKNQAATSAVNAKASEDRAILEASKLGNMNNLAASIESAPGTGDFHVKWKGIHVFKGGWRAASTTTTDLFRSGIWRGTDGSSYNDFVMERGGVARSYLTLAWFNSGKSSVLVDTSLQPKSDIQSLWTGSSAHVDQWAADAPLWTQIPADARNQYFPIIKQKSFQSGADARAWHQGILVGSDGRNNWNIMSTDEGGNSLVWTYTWDGHLDAPTSRDFRVSGDGRHVVTGGSLDKNGKVWGLAYGGGKYLDDFIRENWVGDVYWGASRWVAHNAGQYHDNVGGWGEGCTGVSINNNGTVAGVTFRALWIAFHDGKKRIVASQ